MRIEDEANAKIDALRQAQETLKTDTVAAIAGAWTERETKRRLVRDPGPALPLAGQRIGDRSCWVCRFSGNASVCRLN